MWSYREMHLQGQVANSLKIEDSGHIPANNVMLIQSKLPGVLENMFLWQDILFHDWTEHLYENTLYRLDPDNSNTVNSKFYLIQTFFKILATFLSLQC